jgi:hypothetical protein
LIAYYNGGLPLLRPSVGPVELVYVPKETTGLAFANVHQIMNSDFRQRLRQVLPSGEEKERLQAQIGLDIEKDIESVVAVMMSGEPSISGALVLVRGKFDVAKMEALAVQHGAKVEEYQGKRLLLADAVPAPHVGSPLHAGTEKFTGCLAFLEPGLVAIGDAAAIRRGIDTSASGENATKNAELMSLVLDAQNGSNAWVIGRIDELAKNTTLPTEVLDRMSAVHWFVVSAHVNSGVTGRLRAEARDEETALQLRAAATGLLATGQLMAGRDSRLDAILKSIQVSGSGTSVSMSFAVPLEVLDMMNGAAGIKNLLESTEKPDKSDKSDKAPRTITR